MSEGRMIGPYRLGRTLGSGANGKVKYAVHQETNEEVAIKIVRKASFSERPNLCSKTQREIALMKLIDHPHVLHLVTVLESDRHLFIVLEFCAKGELFDFLTERGNLSEDVALRFFRQIIYGLDYLHNLGICHRDLKPENVLLDAQLNVRIADFGFARFMRTDVANTACGSPHYAAPEVIRGEIYNGKAADVWSCGVLLYALIAGRLPFDDEMVRNLLAKVRSGCYHMPDFRPDVRDLIGRILVVDVSRRLTMAQIKEHPAFRSGLPELYVIPSPLPLLALSEPVQLDSVRPDVVRLLQKIGYRDAQELAEDLGNGERTMAKVFYCMLTANMSLEHMQWEFSVGGIPEMRDESEIMLEPTGMAYRARLGDNDTFHRHGHSASSGQSMESLSSYAANAEWVPGQDEVVYEQMHVFALPNFDLIHALFAVQCLMRQLEMQWFHPDDETIICRHAGRELYVLIQGREADGQNPTTLQLQLCSGAGEGFSILVHAIEEIATP